jgi:hypothetical protein
MPDLMGTSANMVQAKDNQTQRNTIWTQHTLSMNRNTNIW